VKRPRASVVFICALAAAGVLLCAAAEPSPKTAINLESVDAITLKAQQGALVAQLELADRYFYGRGVQTNLDESLSWYAKAARQGNPRARYMIASPLLNHQEATSEEKALALELMRQSANQGYVQAQYELGAYFLYFQKTPEEALEWLRRAADQGHGHAQADLGTCYGEGIGVPKDIPTALLWNRKAAEQGIDTAQLFLGIAYLRGHSVPVDYVEAYKWLTLARQNNLKEGVKWLRQLQGKITQAQVTEGTKRVNAFVPRKDKITQHAGEVFVRTYNAGVYKTINGNPLAEALVH
jgi:uncharacterized protein